jgi:hypothetical protein
MTEPQFDHGKLLVPQASQTIAFGALSNVVSGAPPFAVGATATSDLPVSVALTTTDVCTVSGTVVTLVENRHMHHTGFASL